MSDVKRIDISEFRRLGYLQEVNRQFLHPLGLALEVVVGEDGSERLGGMWDSRDDPEGIVYGDGIIDTEKALYVANARAEKAHSRRSVLGYEVQPA